MSDFGYSRHASGSFKVDKAYLRQQARDAAKVFVAPLAGVYEALSAPSLGKGKNESR